MLITIKNNYANELYLNDILELKTTLNLYTRHVKLYIKIIHYE